VPGRRGFGSAVLLASLLAAWLLPTIGSAQAHSSQPVVYPVRITLALRETSLNGEPAIEWFGRVISPEPACVRHRVLIGVSEIAHGGVREASGGAMTDARGHFHGQPLPDPPPPGSTVGPLRQAIREGEFVLRIRVKRKRLGPGRACAAAISDYLKA
jgi:hypothetical protein